MRGRGFSAVASLLSPHISLPTLLFRFLFPPRRKLFCLSSANGRPPVIVVRLEKPYSPNSKGVTHENDEQDLPKVSRPYGAGHRNGPGRLSARPRGLVLRALRRRRQRPHLQSQPAELDI